MVLENFLSFSFPIQCNSVCSLDAITELLADIIGKSSAWVLDIDLDFYSTGNPYRSLFTDVKEATSIVILLPFDYQSG